jgi:hypothetical protein
MTETATNAEGWEVPDNLPVKKTQDGPTLFGEPVVFKDEVMLTPGFLQKAEAAVEIVKKAKQIALKVTNQRDWIQFGNTAYLTESGCKKIASLFGTSFKDLHVEKEEIHNGNGPVRTYTALVTCLWRGREVTEMGECDSEYDFYKMRRGSVIPFEERDFVSMKKHACTNAMDRALKNILGLGGVLWEEVIQALGGAAQQVAHVQFKGTPPPDAQGSNSPAPIGPQDPPTDHRKRIWDMLLDLSKGDSEMAFKGYRKYGSFEADGKTKYPPDDLKKLSDKWAARLYGTIKKVWLEKGFDKPSPQTGSAPQASEPPPSYSDPEGEPSYEREPGQEG